MAQAEIQEVLSVDIGKFFAAVTRYEDYPKFVEGCISVKVERKAPGKARVTYNVSMIKDISYTLDHEEDEASGRVSWKLVESDFMKANSGSWEIKRAGAGKTDVRYAIEVEFKISVPNLILNRLVKGSLPPMIKSFERQAAKL